MTLLVCISRPRITDTWLYISLPGNHYSHYSQVRTYSMESFLYSPHRIHLLFIYLRKARVNQLTLFVNGFVPSPILYANLYFQDLFTRICELTFVSSRPIQAYICKSHFRAKKTPSKHWIRTPTLATFQVSKHWVHSPRIALLGDLGELVSIAC